MSKQKLPDLLTKEQLVKLFENMNKPKLAIGCFMALMFGLRVSEVCNLEVADIDLQRRQLKVRDSKNTNRKRQGYGKDRFVPINLIAISPIKKWLDIIEGGKYFLPSESSPDKPLRTKSLNEWFAYARMKAGLNTIDYQSEYKKPNPCNNRTKQTIYKIRFHHLRHFFASYVYEKTRDVYVVSSLLGHNQVSTTQVYARCDSKIMRDSVDFAFNIPIRTQQFEHNPINALNYSIPDIAKANKSPVEILEERFARGEISALDFQNGIRLLKLRKEYLNENGEPEPNTEIRAD